MNKWELSRYLIDAKKAVDTMLYLSENAEQVSMIDIRDVVNETRRHFYVNCCVVLDKCYPKQKKDICQNAIISRIYYERDKNSAHKDDNYEKKKYESIEDIAQEMKLQISEVKNICSDYLPDSLTLDFVSFDSKLYRLANGITRDKEDAIDKAKYPFRDMFAVPEGDGIVKKVFNDTEDIRDISDDERNDYATLFRMGICMEESIQHLQDDAIRTNVLFNQDIWVSMSEDNLKSWKKLREAGLVNQFDIPAEPKDDKELERFMGILKSCFDEE
jgi:hypothetical protein